MKKVGGDARPSYSKTIEDSDMKTAFSEAGGARSLGLTGEVLSRKDRLQVPCTQILSIKNALLHQIYRCYTDMPL